MPAMHFHHRVVFAGSSLLALLVYYSQPAASQLNDGSTWPVKVHEINGQPVFGKFNQTLLRSPKVPGGHFSDQVGTFHTIEGVKYDGPLDPKTYVLIVDTVDGIKLDLTIGVTIKNVCLPDRVRCILQGYESGQMYGVPPAEYALVKSGADFAKLQQEIRNGHNYWHWIPHFIALNVVEPQSLEIVQQ